MKEGLEPRLGICQAKMTKGERGKGTDCSKGGAMPGRIERGGWRKKRW